MGAEIESPELRRLAFDLDEAAKVAPTETRKQVQQSSSNIKDGARRRRTGSKYFPRLGYAITYETGVTPTGAYGEIGPDHEKPQGNMGHIPEYGQLKTPAEPYMAPAADEELPKFELGMQALAAKAIEP
jgi:hypothetical protein